MSRGPTVSASEFARLTGVGRERLRTWERRHGFPEPVRARGAARRYAIADLGPVLDVRRAVDQGVPVADAVSAALATAEERSPGPDAQAAMTEAAPSPAILLTGPEPLRVAYLNAAARRLDGAPRPGDVVPGGDEAAALAAAFTARHPGRAARPAWYGRRAVPVLCVPLVAPASRPAALLAVYDLEPEAEQEAREALARAALARDREADLAALRGRVLETCALVAERLQRLAGVDALVEATELLVRRLGALDSALAPYMAGQLVLGRSTRGMLGPEMVTVAGHAELTGAVAGSDSAWLGTATASALGVPGGAHGLVVPVKGAGEPLAVLVLLFEAPFEVGPDLASGLSVVSTALGFAMQQEQLLDAAEESRGPADPGA